MKYWRTFLLAMQTEMQYRANLVLWMVEGALGPFIMVMVWFAIMGGREQIGGFDRGDFIIYYLAITFGWYVIGGEFSRPIGRAIKSGDINKTLLKPYSIVTASMVSEQAWKVMSLVLTLPILLLTLYLTRDYLSLELSTQLVIYLPFTVALGAMLFAILQAMIGTLAFWVTEIWPFADVAHMMQHLFGGMLAPVSLLPQAIQQVSYYLPFRYIFYDPINIFLGQEPDPWGVIRRQAVFVVIMFILFRLEWRAGIRRYEGIGG